MKQRGLVARASLAGAAITVILVTLLAPASAEPPKSTIIGGVRLGDTPANVVDWLKATYPQCRQQRSVYHPLPGETNGPLAIVMINEGTMEVCEGTPEGTDSMDIVVVHFAHPSIVADRGVYEALVERHYPDALASPKKQVRHPLDKVLADLRKRYGKPTDERRERADHSAPASTSARSRAVTQPQHDTIRLLWASGGRLPSEGHAGNAGHSHGHIECDCGDVYVVAEIEATRSHATRPSNRAYVTRVALFVVDAKVRSRQQLWNDQWLNLKPTPSAPPSSPSSREVTPSS
jgi:hypothetical protein